MSETHHTNNSSSDGHADASLKFEELHLSDAVLQAVRDTGYETPSPIQLQSIPPLLQGHDLIGQAQTGTGKTAAFALPLLSRLDLNQSLPQLLVLAPTRELAIQVAEAMQTYARHLPGFHVLPIYGGQNIGIQLKQLRRPVHVVVGTPGRVLDHLRRGTLKLDQLKAVVLDEADEMLRMGFIEDIETILAKTPEERQLVLFSATMPAAIRRISKQYLREPVEIKIKTKTSTVSTITQHFWKGKTTHKLDALTRILESEDFDAIIIFVRTKNMTSELAEKLSARGYAAIALNGDIQQSMREKIIDRLRKGDLDIIVATDVVARGLDVERITHVINYDMPSDTESYVHRIGRTGRAGRSGSAILFVPPRGERMLRAIEKATGQKIAPLKLPTPQDISAARIDSFKQLITETVNTESLDFYENIVRELSEQTELSDVQIAAALTYLQQRERPLKPDMQAIPDRSGNSSGRSDSTARGDERPARKKRKRRDANDTDLDWVTYRLDVGSEHGAQPKHIVGAIANEAGVESRYINNVAIQSDYSTVDLPDGMPKEIFQHLYNVRVQGRKLKLAMLQGNPPETSKRAKKPKRKGQTKDGRKNAGQSHKGKKSKRKQGK